MDKALKQRLVGASVLVALAVLTLPMLLDGQNESRQDARPIEIPPRPPEVEFKPRRFPVGEQAPDQASVLPEVTAEGRDIDRLNESEASSAPVTESESLQQRLERIAEENAAGQEDAESQADEPVGEPQPGQLAPGDSSPAPSLDAPRATAEATTDAEEAVPIDEPILVPPEPVEPLQGSETIEGSGSGRYVVQVASFSSTANASRLAGSLQDAGMPVALDTVDSAAGVLHRVRVGPFNQRAEAEQTMTRLSRQMPDVRPRLVDLRPEEEAPVTRPEDPLVRWVVQVGVFSDTANAEKLVFQLRDAGYRAMSQAETSAGKTVYRVRVGPEVSREAADKLRDRIESEQGIRGIVQSTD
jgi:DedD protein